MSEKRRERSDMVKDIITAVKKGNNRSTMIAKASGLQYMRMSKLLKEMIAEGLLEKKGKEYAVTTRGMMELNKEKMDDLMKRIVERILEDPTQGNKMDGVCFFCENLCGDEIKDHTDDCVYVELRKLCGEKK